jgi:hypothetical protein
VSDMLLEQPVELSQGRRTGGGIIGNTYPLPDGWENGVTFYGAGCTEPQIVAPCAVMDTVGARPGGPDIFEPIWIRQSAACSMLSHVGVIDLARQRLNATSEWALGRALQAGIGTGNVALSDAEVIHSITTPSENLVIDAIAAVSCLEQAVADTGFGAEAFLHAPPRAASWLSAANLNVDGYSPAGHRWIISSGYQGVTVDDETTISLWATGTVFSAVSNREVLRDPSTGRPPIGWQTNSDEAIAQRLGLAAFDPCLLVASTFVVPACVGGS